MAFEEYYPVIVMFGFGVVLTLIFWLLSLLFSPKVKKEVTSDLGTYTSYECGEIPIGEAQTRFNFQYYTFALVFVLFEVLIAFLYAWAPIAKYPENNNSTYSILLLFGFLLAGEGGAILLINSSGFPDFHGLEII